MVAANTSQGAYFSQSWGWVALAFLVPAALALILGRPEAPGRLRAAFALLLGGLALWVAVSATWSLSPSGSLREVERMVVYVSLALAVAVVLRRGDAPALAAGVLAGIVGVSGYGLATRLLPDVLGAYDVAEGYQLYRPIGYKNAVGLLSALGAVLAGGALVHARPIWGRVAAGASLPVLVVTLYFTFSRGAWAAMAFGLLVTFVVDSRRVAFLVATAVVAPVSAVAVVYASRQESLTHEDATIARAADDGRRLLVVLVVLAALSGALAGAWALVARRFPLSRRFRRAVEVAVAALAAAALAAGLVAVGGPRAAAVELKDRFDAPYRPNEADLNTRFFSVSGNRRSEPLGVAWDMAAERPLAGYGAGTFEYVWYERRPTDKVLRDAHSLYLETFAELGAVGLGMLALALALPLVGAAAGRRARLVPPAAGAYCAWAAHAGLDWDWEIVGLTATALLAGSVPLLGAERRPRRPLPGSLRQPALAVAVGLSVVAVVSLVGNQALFAGKEAVARKEWRSARDHARRAEALLPWSHEPVLVVGDAQAGLGNRAAALEAYREAVDLDPRNWVAWLRLAQVASGRERAEAYARVHELDRKAHV